MKNPKAHLSTALITTVITCLQIADGQPLQSKRETGENVRTIQFKEVLESVAEKAGFDPSQGNFITDEAVPIGRFINEWMRRSYDAQDWPEWTITKQFAPVNHVVPWDYAPVNADVRRKLGRIIAVFLVDPAITNVPCETDYTLTDVGVHVGFQHGSSVWIRYIAPAPRFTAEVWTASQTFKQDQVTYSPRTGEVYRSKSNSNRGHDPATSFSLPPEPSMDAPAIPPPTAEMTQDWVPGNAGVVEQDQIVDVLYQGGTQDIPDPPPTNTVLYVRVADSTGAELADATSIASGSQSVADILDDLVSQLVADVDLASFTITANHTTSSIRLQDASNFKVDWAFWTPFQGSNISVPTQQVQAYIPAVSAAAAQPRITRITITSDTTYPGNIYSLEMIGTDGVLHTVSYASTIDDNSAQIVNGLLAAVASSSDTFWIGVQFTFDPDALTLDVAISDNASTDVHVDAPPPPAGGAWWELVPFPLTLADQVIRGANADVLKEWGQTPEGQAEEQAVGSETAVRAQAFTSQQTLTEERKPTSRYQLR